MQTNLLQLVLDGLEIGHASVEEGKSANLKAEMDADSVRVTASTDGVSLSITAVRSEPR